VSPCRDDPDTESSESPSPIPPPFRLPPCSALPRHSHGNSQRALKTKHPKAAPFPTALLPAFGLPPAPPLAAVPPAETLLGSALAAEGTALGLRHDVLFALELAVASGRLWPSADVSGARAVVRVLAGLYAELGALPRRHQIVRSRPALGCILSPEAFQFPESQSRPSNCN
jgi:hypothetical protein